MQHKPIKILENNKVIQVSSGLNHTAAVTSDNKIWIWGKNSEGQLGLGDTNPRTIPTLLPDFDNVKQVSVGGRFTVFITSEGKSYITGNDPFFVGNDEQLWNIFTKIHYLNWQKIDQISCSPYHIAAVNDQGKVFLWGVGTSGELGLGNFDTERQPHLLNLDKKIKQVACGYGFTLFLTDEGEVYACGINGRGQLGLRGVGEINYPQKIHNLPPISQVAAGGFHSLFLTITGEVYVCGSNSDYQLGIGETHERNILTPIKNNFLPQIKQVSGGHERSAFISSQGEIYMCGNNGSGVLGLGLPYQVIKIPTPIPHLADIIYVSCGEQYTALISRN